MEMIPEYYYELNQNRFPMGAHDWWSFNPEFYLNLLGPDADIIRETVMSCGTKSCRIKVVFPIWWWWVRLE